MIMKIGLARYSDLYKIFHKISITEITDFGNLDFARCFAKIKYFGNLDRRYFAKLRYLEFQ